MAVSRTSGGVPRANWFSAATGKLRPAMFFICRLSRAASSSMAWIIARSG